MNKSMYMLSLVVAIIAIVGVGGMYIKAQWFDDGSFLTTSTIKSDNVSRLSAAGSDLRVYEVTPLTAPYMQCVAIAGENKIGVDCFVKRDYAPSKATITTP